MVNGAYHKIHMAQLHGPGHMLVQVNIFASEQTRRDNLYVLETRNYGIDMPIARADETILNILYRALKDLPEYNGATDV